MCCLLVQVYLCTCTWSLATFFMPVAESLFSSPAVSLSFLYYIYMHRTQYFAFCRAAWFIHYHYWCQHTDFSFQQLVCRAVGFMHLHYWCPSAGLCDSCTTITDANLQILPSTTLLQGRRLHALALNNLTKMLQNDYECHLYVISTNGNQITNLRSVHL